MPTIFGHAVVGLTLARLAPSQARSGNTYLLAAACSMLPDADMVAHSAGFAHSVLGHRGITHSLAFAAVIGIVVATLFVRSGRWRTQTWWLTALLFASATASHALLDACTNGGSAVALLAPFSWQGVFSPWRPLEVSPFWFGIFSGRGEAVLRSELLWLALPCAIIWAWIADRQRRMGR